MGFLKKLFGGIVKSESSKSPATPLASTGAPATERGISDEWRRFLATAPLHSTAHGLMSLVGQWPSGVSPERFAPHNWPETIRKVKGFLEGPYPCEAFSDVKPEYIVLDDGRIARKSNRFSDLLICGVLPIQHRAAAVRPRLVGGIRRYAPIYC